MTNYITPISSSIVPFSNKVAPIRAIDKIALDTNQSRADYSNARQEAPRFERSAAYSEESFSPFFAAHLLYDAGFAGQDVVLNIARRAYAKRLQITQNTIAFA